MKMFFKMFFVFPTFIIASIISCRSSSQPAIAETTQGTDSLPVAHKSDNMYYLDVHHIGPGKVKYEAVAQAHAKDLAVQEKYGVHFIKYWVDEADGNVYCLSSAADSQSIRKTHAEAHGLLPDQIYAVTGGTEASLINQDNFFLDVHELGAGKVSAKDVAAAHQKDLSVEKKYGVNFTNYWVNEKEGRVVCLSQAPDSAAVIKTHKEAHGLIPVSIVKVKPGK
ncbi:MAG: DUF4242 domain-containing protein [Bacteroidota bacterium]|nr:DUF4242 domain-containing protein [Bacteroidota bacterium]